VSVVEIDEKHWIARLGDRQLPLERQSDQETRVQDIRLAEFVGFKRPRNIRRLIRNMIAAGKLSDVHCRSVTERQSTGQGGEREFTVVEYWLTRTQALLVVTQSDTPRAWEMTKAIVSAFEQTLDGRVSDNSQLAGAILKLSEAVTVQGQAITALAVRVGGIEERLTAPQPNRHGLLGEAGAREILNALQEIAGYYAVRKTPAWRAKRRSVDLEVREAAGLTKRRWEHLDIANEGAAWNKIGELRAKAQAEAAARTKAELDLRQTTLFDALPAGIKAFKS
jgi:hypothetical protein